MRRIAALLLGAATLSACYASHELTADGSASEGGYCRQACSSAGECGLASLYECRDGLCEFVGCADDSDCPSTLTCAPAWPGAELPSCAERCSADSECVAFGTFGPQRCIGGACVFVGCPSDEWCADRASLLWPGSTPPRQRCEARPDGVSLCIAVCDSDVDCSSETFDAPQVCHHGHCVFEECTSDAQCNSWWADIGEEFRCVP